MPNRLFESPATESRLRDFTEAASHLVVPDDAAREPLTPSAYIQQINVMFRNLTTQMADHDVALAPNDLLADYCTTPGEAAIFTPTALRQIHHFYANYVQSLQFLSHPTLAFQTNRRDTTTPTPLQAVEQNILIHGLNHNLTQTEQALSIFAEKVAQSGDMGVHEQLQAFHHDLNTLTRQFCNDNQLDILSPDQPDNARAMRQKGPLHDMHLN